MPFIPHTDSDVLEMLKVIGVNSIEDLFDEIPDSLKIEDLDLPDGQSEMAVTRVMKSLAARDGTPQCFAGAGAYEHHIPAAVWQITTRGEFYSAYTPYQAEASQGTLQLIYEYQTMMAKLTAMEVSNASLYDGASALAEAALMAVRANRKSKSRRILVPETLNPAYRRVMESLLAPQQIELVSLPISESGTTDPALLDQYAGEDITAVVVVQPNFFGVLEAIDELTNRAHGLGALVIGVINPMSLAMLEAPGHWGEAGADIVCGDGQPLGVPLSSGGPYFGILCCKQAFVRQMPGRLVGRTTDLDGRPGYALTLQAREQHIRRAKATSNICTNQGLLVTAATIYMALMGPRGLQEVAAVCHKNTVKLRDALSALDSVSVRYDSPVFHEVAIELPMPAADVIERLAEQNFVAGYDLGRDYPGMENCLLLCATETKTDADIEGFVAALAGVIA